MSQLQLLPLHRFVPGFAISNMQRVFACNASMHTARLFHIAFILFLLGGCERTETSIVDSAGRSPVLTEVTLSPSRINSDTIDVGASRQPDDLLTVSTLLVARVRATTQLPISTNFSVISSDSLNAVSRGTLQDDGKAPDTVSGDGLFTGKASFNIRRVQIGAYSVQVQAESEDGYRSSTIIKSLTVFRGNHTPVISDLVAPDTVKLGSQSQVLLFTLRANDQDGLNDIARVVFNSFRPDGSASGGNPFLMYDDGLATHGDERAGDGTFSLLISLPATTQLGTYRFEFRAFDRSSDPSNLIVHRLTVKP